MGLRDDISTGHGEVFSEDVLKVEVHGPNEDYLTIIDVPGIFRATTRGTTKDDMVMVKDLVKHYIKEDRTIILAVLPSTADIGTQEILELAEEYDPNGERTLGVLTKPDLVLEPSAQAAVCDIVHGKKRALTLGYFLVRNRGADSDYVDQRELDEIFKQNPWNDLPRERLGILALKKQLGSLLVDISRREFPKLVRDVNHQIRECKRELDNLGPSRQDEREQRSCLSRIAETFQDRARAALAADYNADPVFEQDELRLITHVVNITDVFGADFQEGAHSRRFEIIGLPSTPPSPTPPVDSASETEAEAELQPAEVTKEKLRALIQAAKVDELTPVERAELDGIVVLPETPSMPTADIAEWINAVYLRSRGLDLGTFNAHLVSVAFAEQSRKWGVMTQVYMSRVIITVHRFMAAALRSVCPDEQARTQLWSAILEKLQNSYRMAMKQAALLVEVEQRKQPYTLNKQFNEAFCKARGYRHTELLRPKARKDIKQYGSMQYMVNLDDVAGATKGKGNVEHLQEEIHDILRAYYSLALDRFIDNIFQLAVDYHLLHGPSSPLRVFRPDWVIDLEPDHLERIIGETKAAKKRRSKIMRKIEDLSNALRILRI